MGKNPNVVKMAARSNGGAGGKAEVAAYPPNTAYYHDLLERTLRDDRTRKSALILVDFLETYLKMRGREV